MRRSSARPLNDARPFQVGRGALIVLASAVFALLLAPASVLAEEAPAEKASAEAEAEVEVEEGANVVGAPMACGKIAAARYPFLACVRGPSGGPVFASAGEGITGHVTIRSKFVRENGHWGPSGIE